MKKSTLILLTLAIVVGGLVYYFEYRRPSSAAKNTDESQPAFKFQTADITGLTIIQPSQTMALSKNNGEWEITQPVDTRADQSAVEDIVNGVSTARSSRTLSATPEQLRSYGLDKPALTLQLKLKSGEQHRLRVGDKDFSGMSVYAQADDSKDVLLVPDSVRTRAEKPLDDIRDRSVLSFSTWDVNSFELKNASGEIALAKKDTDWKIQRPRELPADSSQVTTLLSNLSSAKITKVASETSDDLAKYGLTKPVASIQLHLAKGEERSLLIGSKSGDDYYARDTSRRMIFLVPANVYDKLQTKPFDLRNKKAFQGQPEDFSRIELHNSNGKLVAATDAEGKWKVQEPADQKDKELEQWKVFVPLENAVATEIVDSPSATQAALLAKPGVEVQLTRKSGATQKFSISSASGDNVYIRTSDGPSLYQVPKKTLEDLNFKFAEAVR